MLRLRRLIHGQTRIMSRVAHGGGITTDSSATEALPPPDSQEAERTGGETVGQGAEEKVGAV